MRSITNDKHASPSALLAGEDELVAQIVAEFRAIKNIKGLRAALHVFNRRVVRWAASMPTVQLQQAAWALAKFTNVEALENGEGAHCRPSHQTMIQARTIAYQVTPADCTARRHITRLASSGVIDKWQPRRGEPRRNSHPQKWASSRYRVHFGLTIGDDGQAVPFDFMAVLTDEKPVLTHGVTDQATGQATAQTTDRTNQELVEERSERTTSCAAGGAHDDAPLPPVDPKAARPEKVPGTESTGSRCRRLINDGIDWAAGDRPLDPPADKTLELAASLLPDDVPGEDDPAELLKELIFDRLEKDYSALGSVKKTLAGLIMDLAVRVAEEFAAAWKVKDAPAPEPVAADPARPSVPMAVMHWSGGLVTVYDHHKEHRAKANRLASPCVAKALADLLGFDGSGERFAEATPAALELIESAIKTGEWIKVEAKSTSADSRIEEDSRVEAMFQNVIEEDRLRAERIAQRKQQQGSSR